MYGARTSGDHDFETKAANRMLKNASCHGKWQMEDGKPQCSVAFSIYHLPFSIQGRHFSAAS